MIPWEILSRVVELCEVAVVVGAFPFAGALPYPFVGAFPFPFAGAFPFPFAVAFAAKEAATAEWNEAVRLLAFAFVASLVTVDTQQQMGPNHKMIQQ